MKILAIETSCDETAIAIVEANGGIKSPSFRILSNVVASQIKVHAPFGGVVPNLAKREHQKNLMPVLLQALSNIQCSPSTLNIGHAPPIDAIAVTVGPGLAPALWVGVNFAKELARTWKKSLIPVNHMDGHIASVLLDAPNIQCSPSTLNVGPHVNFPALALLVSGGHTELVFMKNWKNKKIIGETLDDAAGEAFDKVARMLGLRYPGGPAIAACANQKLYEVEPRKNLTRFNLNKITLPRPMLLSKNYNFSFSGLKTAVLYLIERLKKEGHSIKKLCPAIAKEFQDAVVDVLVAKTIRSAKEYRVKTIILGGGVAANDLLRKTLGEKIKQQLHNTCYLLPDAVLTGDNAAMIAAAAYLFGKKKEWKRINVNANLR